MNYCPSLIHFQFSSYLEAISEIEQIFFNVTDKLVLALKFIDSEDRNYIFAPKKRFTY
jgi:hypothetical protein